MKDIENHGTSCIARAGQCYLFSTLLLQFKRRDKVSMGPRQLLRANDLLGQQWGLNPELGLLGKLPQWASHIISHEA